MATTRKEWIDKRINEIEQEIVNLEIVIQKSDPAFEGALLKQIDRDLNCLELEKKRLANELLNLKETL